MLCATTRLSARLHAIAHIYELRKGCLRGDTNPRVQHGNEGALPRYVATLIALVCRLLGRVSAAACALTRVVTNSEVKHHYNSIFGGMCENS